MDETDEGRFEGVTIRHRQTGGVNEVIAAVSAAALVPFVQALAGSAADSAYESIRRLRRSGSRVRIGSRERQITVIVAEGTPDDALVRLARVDFAALPHSCVLRWDQSADEWQLSSG